MQADWFISEAVSEVVIENTITDMDDYVFDPNYFEKIGIYDNLQDGWAVVFKLLNYLGETRYLHLYNCHSGYYSHGFEVEIGGNQVRKGRI